MADKINFQLTQTLERRILCQVSLKGNEESQSLFVDTFHELRVSSSNLKNGTFPVHFSVLVLHWKERIKLKGQVEVKQ